MIGLCNVVKCKVLANLSENEYKNQLNDIKKIYDDNKEAQNITQHRDEMLDFIKKNVEKPK